MIIAAFGLVPPRGRRVLACELPSLSHALNVGLEASRGRFVARMDSDDICLPARFRRQIAILATGEIDLLFGSVTLIDAAGEDLPEAPCRCPRHPDFVATHLFHPTLMAERATLVALGGYGNVEGAEDHHLWLRATERGYRFGKMDEPTLRYRRHDGQASWGPQSRDGFVTTIGLDVAYGLRHRRWPVVRHALRQAGRDVLPGVYHGALGRAYRGWVAVKRRLGLRPW